MYYTKVILMLQWYNDSIDITTISIHTHQYLHLYYTYLLPPTINWNILQKVILRLCIMNHFSLLISYIFGSLRFLMTIMDYNNTVKIYRPYILHRPTRHTHQYLHLNLHLLTATKNLLQYITNSNPQAAPKITYTYLHHYYCTITALT